MPTKQIYLRNEDMALFAEAEQYGDSMSKVIVEAVRDFVEKKRAERDEEGFTEMEIEVGRFEPEPKDIKITRFVGMFITKGCESEDVDVLQSSWESEWVVYRTKKGKFLIYRKHTETGFDPFDQEKFENINASYYVLDEWPEDGADKMLDKDVFFPKWLISRVNQAVFGTKTEWLDI